jgi:hypothetical protein
MDPSSSVGEFRVSVFRFLPPLAVALAAWCMPACSSDSSSQNGGIAEAGAEATSLQDGAGGLDGGDTGASPDAANACEAAGGMCASPSEPCAPAGDPSLSEACGGAGVGQCCVPLAGQDGGITAPVEDGAADAYFNGH